MTATTLQDAPSAATQEFQAPALQVLPLTGRIGAEIRGLHLSGALAPGVFAQVRQALFKHRVLFFRGQQHLDDAGTKPSPGCLDPCWRTPRCRWCRAMRR